MSDVKRYSITGLAMLQNNGPWIPYTDYAELEAENARLKLPIMSDTD